MSTSPKPHIIIAGAGAWGSSTVVSLLKSGKYEVTLLDRATTLPAEDAASTDINKIVRFDYQEDVYAELAFKALQAWRQKEWEGMYFECGTVVSAPRGEEDIKLDKTIATVSKRGKVHVHDTPEEVRRALDPSNTGVAGKMEGHRGYSNPQGGWVDAAKATGALIKLTVELGGKVVPGAEVSEWVMEDGDVKGVKCADGRVFKGDKVIIASGAWTQGLMKDLMPKGLLTSCGITVAAFKLSEEEYERYKDIPVIMGWGDVKFYSMPPTHDRMLKFGLDEPGYTSQTGIPRTTLTPGAKEWHNDNGTTWLPRQSYEGLRIVVDSYFPEFSKRAFDFTRMCPIPATFDDNFVLDYTKYSSLLIASGGSHHSYKMMPIIGDLVKARMENTLDPALTKLWSLRDPKAGEGEGGHAALKDKGRTNVEDITYAGVEEVPQIDAKAGVGLERADIGSLSIAPAVAA